MKTERVQEKDWQSVRESLEVLIRTADVMGYGLEAIYREDDPTPAACVRCLKEGMIRLRRNMEPEEVL